MKLSNNQCSRMTDTLNTLFIEETLLTQPFTFDMALDHIQINVTDSFPINSILKI